MLQSNNTVLDLGVQHFSADGTTSRGANNIVTASLIAANAGDGIHITGSGATGNVIDGDTIGAATAATIAVANNGFEVPNMGSGSGAYAYDLTGGSWTFQGGTGITANNSAWGVADAPNGNSNGTTSTAGQTAFIQGGNGATSGSVFYQTLSGFGTGTATVTFALQGRAGFGVNPITVMLDGQSLGTYSPQSTSSFNTVTTPPVAVTAGSHVLYFIGTNGSGDNDTFVDNVSVANVLGAPGNGSAGVLIDRSAASNTIGGTGPAARNVISGNGGNGVEIDDSGQRRTWSKGTTSVLIPAE